MSLFSFLSIPNGPAGLLVSVNEEPVHSIGILYFLCLTSTIFERQDRVCAAHTQLLEFTGPLIRQSYTVHLNIHLHTDLGPLDHME